MLPKKLVRWLLMLTVLASSASIGAARTRTAAAPPPTPTPPPRDSNAAPFEISIIVHPDGTWEGQARLSKPGENDAPDARGKQVKQEAAAILGNYEVHYTWGESEDNPASTTTGIDAGETVVQHRLFLKGENAQEITAMALQAGNVVKRLAGPIALEINGAVRQGQTPALTLPGNPSTGYSWFVEPAGNDVIIQLGDVKTHQITFGLGTPAAHITRFRASKTGLAGLRLVYRRPWLTDLPPAVVVSVQPAGSDLADVCSTLSIPSPARSSDATAGAQDTVFTPATRRPQQDDSVSQAQTLPSTFDWCDQNGCTTIKDQGHCGSCWAFATVGVLESALQLWQERTTDLSEQYLVSCNTHGWSCNGGWWAHDYHLDRTPPSESQAGAVLEAAAPYQSYYGDDFPCEGPYNHPHRITSWYHVGDSDVSSVEAIKQAIYTHGPVASAICVGNAFHNYTGGVFQTNETCDSTVNHAVILVGWDDSQQAWILRNSWGTGWGESGYMRIRYGTSNVGYAANYITIPEPFVASAWVHLPLLAYNQRSDPPPVPGDTIRNGDFESGNDGSWSESSSNGWSLIYQSSSLPVSPHGGSWATWLGGANEETSILAQEITVPADATTLNYWYWTASEDFCGYDYAYVNLGSSTLKTYNLCEDTNTGGWTLQQVTVTNWRGQTVDLRFIAANDYSLNSNFFLDDVSLSTTAMPHDSLNFVPASEFMTTRATTTKEAQQ